MRTFPDSSFLRRNYAPWPLEGEITDLVVRGELPPELNGTLWRNGPNPQFPPRGAYHWFDGDGMIHALRFQGGRASYRNRWVRTARFQLERAAGEALFGGLADLGSGDPRVAQALTSPNAANTNVVWHAGRLLALWEGGPPHALDARTLDTLGPYDFAGRLAGAMTAHPKLDPESGEMHCFGYGLVKPFLRYHVADATGRLVRSEEIDVPVPTMMHDFLVTQRHVLFLVCPATVRLENVEKTGSPIGWEPELGTQIGVMPRDGGSRDVRWFQTDASYVFHALNAYEDGECIVADVCRYAQLPLFEAGEAVEGQEQLSARLTRWTLDLVGGSVKEERLDDLASEFPRFDERRAGLPYRHGYAAAIVPGAERPAGFDAIAHFDLAASTRREHRLPASDATGEPIFVPRRADAAEGDGFLLAVVYRGAERRSDVLVLDAQNVAAEPLAVVELPHRIPFGFHGNWGPGV